MYYFKSLLALLLLTVTTILQSCDGKGKVIKKDKFALIISEMYLVDQFVDQHPLYRTQTDTAALYDAIFKKHGYSREDYQTSVQSYLKKGRVYKEIYQEARKILSEREAELKTQVELKNGIVRGWWASDTVKTIPIEKLEENTYFRAIKWILITEMETKWRIDKPEIKDIPQNAYWWKNNVRLTKVDTINQKHGILLKDYLLNKNEKKTTLPKMDSLIVENKTLLEIPLPNTESREERVHRRRSKQLNIR